MIALLITILLISLAAICFCIFMVLNIKSKTEIIIKNNDAITELYKEIADIRKDITDLKNNPAEFTRRFTLIDFRLKKMEDAIASFNNGFKYQESWMR